MHPLLGGLAHACTEPVEVTVTHTSPLTNTTTSLRPRFDQPRLAPPNGQRQPPADSYRLAHCAGAEGGSAGRSVGPSPALNVMPHVLNTFYFQLPTCLLTLTFGVLLKPLSE
jgi:hypothetical protein